MAGEKSQAASPKAVLDASEGTVPRKRSLGTYPGNICARR